MEMDVFRESALKMRAASTSETSAIFSQTATEKAANFIT
jgi:hypothetical protein